MNFIKAKEALAKIAKGEYHSLRYEVKTYSTGTLDEQECTVYVHGYSHHSKPTWKKALTSLRQEIKPKKKLPIVVESIEECPF